MNRDANKEEQILVLVFHTLFLTGSLASHHIAPHTGSGKTILPQFYYLDTPQAFEKNHVTDLPVPSIIKYCSQ